MLDVLVVCPQPRDLRAIESAGLERSYRVHVLGEDLDSAATFDAQDLLAAAAAASGGRRGRDERPLCRSLRR